MGTELISAEIDGVGDSGGTLVRVTATKIAAATTSITFGRLGSTLECPRTKLGLKQPSLFDMGLGEALDGNAFQSGVWKVSDTEFGARVYTAEISTAMLRTLWQQQEARGLGHAVSVTGGAASALVLACVTRQNEDDSVDVLDSAIAEMCMDRVDLSRSERVQDGGCTVPRAALTGVYGTPGSGDIHISLETRVHPACQEDPADGMHYLKNSFVKVFDEGNFAAAVVPMGSSATGCEDRISVGDDGLTECLQTWDVVVSGVAADANTMNLAAGFTVVSKSCADNIAVQATFSLDDTNNDIGKDDIPTPAHPQDVATSTNHLHVQVRTATESAKSEVHMRGLGDGARAYAFNDGERNCLEIRSDHPSLLDDRTSLRMHEAVLHRCAPKAVADSAPAVRNIGYDNVVEREPVKECVAAGDLFLVRNGHVNHGFSGFMNGRIAYDETTVSLCFTPDVDVFEAGTLEVAWMIERTQTQTERREAARAAVQRRGSQRWKPALEIELEEQARRRAREEEAAAAGIDLDERHMGCHGPECNGTIIIPIHVGCQDDFFFVHHINQCVPWPVYGGLRFLRVAWIPFLLVFIVTALTCIICYGAMSNRYEIGSFEGHKMH